MPEFPKFMLRAVDVVREKVDEEGRTVELTFSSEEPVDRWFGREVLDHGSRSARLGRLRAAAPFLVNHDPDDQVGVVEKAWIDSESRKGCALVRLGRSQRAEEIWQDMLDGIRRNVSFAYALHRDPTPEGKPDENGVQTFRFKDWEPLEISTVAISADVTVGIGRDHEGDISDPVRQRLMRRFETMGDESKIPVQEKPQEAQIATMQAGPDIQAVLSGAALNERTRCSLIASIARTNGMDELGRQFIESGRTVDDFRAAVLERIQPERPKVVEIPKAPEIGLNLREKRQYNLLRVVNAILNPQSREAQEAAAFEFEVSEATLKAQKRNLRTGFGGQAQFTIPEEVFSGRRDVFLGTASGTASNLVATDLMADNFIEYLRNRAMVMQAGATVLNGLVGNVAIPRRSGVSVAYWVAEGTAPTESTAVAFDQVTMSPNTIGAFVDYTRKTLLQATPAIEGLLRSDLFAVIGLGIDAAAINGAGTGATPAGIIPTTAIGTSSMGAQAAAPTWAGVVAPETAVATGNADVGKLAYMTSPAVRGSLKTTVKGTAGALGYLMEPDGTVNGYPCYITNQVPTTLTYGTTTGSAKSLIFGNWADLLIGMWSGVDILVDPFTASSTGSVRIVALQDVDIKFRQTASFNKLLGIS